MNIIYLVDLENICARPLYQYAEEHQDAEYIVFYSDNTSSPDSLLEGLPDTVRVTFIDCKTGGNNAMDFCICAIAGHLSVRRMVKIKILSNDKGYDQIDQQDIETVIKRNVPKKYQGDLINAISNAIDRKEAHEMCQAILPGNIAVQTYRKLRKYIPKEVV